MFYDMQSAHEPFAFQSTFHVEVTAVSSTSSAASSPHIFMAVCGHVMTTLLCAALCSSDSDTGHGEVS